MEREFLRNFKVGDTGLPDVIIDAILSENARDIEAAKANPGANGGHGGKSFTQDDVNRIVSERLAREREKQLQQPRDDEREQALKARESRLDCRDYLDSKKYPAALLDVLDCSDVDRFKDTVDALAKEFPTAFQSPSLPPRYSVGAGTTLFLNTDDPVAAAFKPHKT